MNTGSLLRSLATTSRFAHISLSVTATLLGLAVSEVGAEPATSGIGIITAVQGQVTVVHPLAKSPVPAKVDTDVLFRDIIETQNESRTKALFDDETLLTVGEHSRVEITEHIYNPNENRRSMVVKLVRGKLRALISKVFDGSGSKFEIHTPTAVAAARGTYFVVWAQGERSGVVNIGTSGRVDFTSGGQTVSLAPGEFSVAPAGMAPMLPAAFSSKGLQTGPPQIGTQELSLLAGVLAVIHETELLETPRAMAAIPAVPAIPTIPGRQGTPAPAAAPATSATPVVPATPPAVISGAFPARGEGGQKK